MAARRRRIVKLPVNFLSPFFTHPLLIPSHPQPPTPPPSPILCSRYRALRGAICRRVNDWTIITFFFIVVRRQSGTERPIYTGRMRHRYARPSPPGTGKTRNSAVRALQTGNRVCILCAGGVKYDRVKRRQTRAPFNVLVFSADFNDFIYITQAFVSPVHTQCFRICNGFFFSKPFLQNIKRNYSASTAYTCTKYPSQCRNHPPQLPCQISLLALIFFTFYTMITFKRINCNISILCKPYIYNLRMIFKFINYKVLKIKHVTILYNSFIDKKNYLGFS